MVQVGLDFTLFIQIAQFLIIFLIVRALIVKPIYSNISSRNAKVASLLERAKKSREEVSMKKSEYEERLKAIRAEISDYQKKVKAEASASASAILDKMKEATKRDAEKARAEIVREVGLARASLDKEINALSEQIVKAVVNL